MCPWYSLLQSKNRITTTTLLFIWTNDTNDLISDNTQLWSSDFDSKLTEQNKHRNNNRLTTTRSSLTTKTTIITYISCYKINKITSTTFFIPSTVQTTLSEIINTLITNWNNKTKISTIVSDTAITTNQQQLDCYDDNNKKQ